jgi:hypothetical protein
MPTTRTFHFGEKICTCDLAKKYALWIYEVQNAAGFMLPKLVVETLSAHRLAFRALTCIFSKNREAELHFAVCGWLSTAKDSVKVNI